MSGGVLQRVAFRKPRAHAARLSAPYVPGRRHERYWSDTELAVVREHYADKGAAYCASLLPRRQLRQVYAKAYELGLYRGDASAPRRPPVKLTPELERQIREKWPGMSGRGAVQALADELGIPRARLSDFIEKLGLTMPHKKEPPWSAAEIELMRRVPLHSPQTASRIFAEHGFQRTATSIVVKAKRLSLSRRYRETLSATQAAAILGVDAKNFALECAGGQVKAEKRETRRLPQQGGHPWSIRREDLRQYVIDNIGRIDIRKVDRFAFVDLLVNAGASCGAPCAS